MLVKLIYGLNVVKANEYHHGFFPNHLLLVLHQCKHYVLHGRDDMSMAKLGYHIQRCHDLQMVLRLQVFLQRGDQKNQNVARLVNKEGTRQVANTLHEDVFTLGEVHCVDMAEAGIVSEHFNKHS